MKEDEILFFLAVYRMVPTYPRHIYPRMKMPWKRARYLLRKWEKKGWYEAPVSIDLGWLLEPGKTKAMALIHERSKQIV